MRPNLKRITLLIAVLVYIFCMAGCKGCEKKKPLQQIELKESAETLAVKFKRFDQDLFSFDVTKPQAASKLLREQYGNFFCDFVELDIRLAPCNSDSLGNLLIPFIQDEAMRQSNAEIQKVFSEETITEIKTDISQMLQRWNHFFPDSIVPSVVFYQSAWNNNIAPSDSTLGIALDAYLGYENKLVQRLNSQDFPNYKKQGMDKKFLLADAAKGWIAYQARSYYKESNFLNELIFYGKLMYLAEALVPDVADELMMNWSGEQLAWAQTNEWNIWKEMANEKVMYMTKRFEIAKWFTDGPFTNASRIPQDSPPQLGVWMGWNIVRQYMEKFPQTTLHQLLEEKDSRKILAAYKPKR